MFSVLVAIALLLACAGAIFLLLKNMGQSGVEIAAPGSCKSGRCGVQCETGKKEVMPEELPEVDVADGSPAPVSNGTYPRA